MRAKIKPMNAINRQSLNPPESPRAIVIPSLRAPLQAVLRHFKRDRWLTKPNEAVAQKLVKEADELGKALNSDPGKEAEISFAQQQAEIGQGQGAEDVWSRKELREEAFVRVHAARGRLVNITAEVAAIIAPIKAEAEQLCLKMADDLEADEKKLSESVGIPYVQASLTIQILRDIPRRMVKLIPPPGVNGNIRTMLQPFLEIDPVVVRQALDVHLDEKKAHAKTLASRLLELVRREPSTRSDEITKANEAKEARKRLLSKLGVIKLSSGKPDPTWAAINGGDAPLAPSPAVGTPEPSPAPQPPLPKL